MNETGYRPLQGSLEVHGHLEEGYRGGIQVQQVWYGERGKM